MTPTATAAAGMPPVLFSFGTERIRVLTDAAGEPWFVVADVCRVLAHSNPTMALQGIADDDLNTAEVIDSIGRTQVANIINETGLYQLVFSSRVEKAKDFTRWVTKEVLPQIRKTGSYAVSPAIPLTYKEAVQALLVQIEAKEALAIENSALRPKAEFFDAVTASDDTLGMNEACKVIGLGRNKVMDRLRKLQILRRNNTPYQEYLDAGYFKVVESKWTDSKGDNHVTLSTRVFQRGVEFIRRKLIQPA